MDSSQEIDFMSLDVEGYELNVLRGLTLSKYRPKYMLIEVYATDFDDICTHLEAHDYTLVENVTNYNKNDNPNWDGTHNDYLFRSKWTKRCWIRHSATRKRPVAVRVANFILPKSSFWRNELYGLQTRILEDGTKDEMRVFEVLFNGS